MPWTWIHPLFGWFIIHYCFKANLHSSAVFWSILWGSILPDLPHHLFIFWHYFICDDVYFTNWGCNRNFITNSENWTHSLPLSLIFTIISYTVYCKVSHKTIKNAFCPWAKLKSSTKKILPPTHSNKNKIEEEHMQNTDGNKKIQSEENQLLEKEIIFDASPQFLSPQIEIVSIKTYSSISSIKNNYRRYSSFEYRYGHWLTCKNCWCDKQSFWMMCAYLFLSMFIHSSIDFAFHRGSAREQLLPFSRYIWQSPMSYHGVIESSLFCAISIGLIVWIHFHKRNDWKSNSMIYYYFWCLVLCAVMIWAICMIILAIAQRK